MLLLHCLFSIPPSYRPNRALSLKAYRPFQRLSKSLGFSLLEVLCVLFVLTLLAAAGWSNAYSGLLQETPREKIQTAQTSLASGLLLARQHAVTSQQSLTLCGGIASAEGGECDGDWSSGWFILQTDNIKKYQTFTDDVTITWSGFPTKKTFLYFHATGLTDYQNGTFYLCLGEWQTYIVVNQSGRFYLGDISNVVSEGANQC